MSSTKVYLVQHVHEQGEDHEDVKLIGIYTTEQNALDAIARLSRLPGFAETANGFHVDKYELDRDHWTEGFIM